MATAAASVPAPVLPTGPSRIRSRSGKGKDASQLAGANGPQPAVRLKIVIRHLPSLLKESEFKDALAQYINDANTDWIRWEQGKVSSDRNKPPVPTRCYIKMKNPADISALSQAIRSQSPFSDSKGNATTPQIEFSPFQKVPKKSPRVDARAGTIESDPDFQAFVASLNPQAVPSSTDGPHAENELPDVNKPAPIPANDPLSVPLPSGEKPEKPKTTPLIEFLRTQKLTDKASKAPKVIEKTSSSDSSSGRPSKRAERRAREKAAKAKAKDKGPEETSKGPEPTALLKRAGSSIASSSSSAPGPSTVSKPEPREKGVEKDKDKERERPRERRRGGAGGVAAILQRDLGLATNPRRSRAAKVATTTEGESATASASTPSSPAVTPSQPVQPQQQPPESPKPSRSGRPEKPSRRERRAAKLEREESTASSSSAKAVPPSAPMAILKKQGSNLSTGGNAAPSGPAPQLLKRDSIPKEPAAESSPSAVPPTAPPAASTPTPTTPTAPRAARNQHRGRGSGPFPRGSRTEVAPPPVSPAQASVPNVVPTGPADTGAPRGRRGGGRGGGMFRGGRGGGPRGGMRGGRGESSGPKSEAAA